MSKFVKLTLEGGFHDSAPINIRVPEYLVERIKEEGVRRYVSDNVERKLDKHFCGIKDCQCGGVSCAKIKKHE